MKASEFDRKFDDGENVLDDLDITKVRRPNAEMQLVSPKGRVKIPAALRKKYGLKPGTRVHIVDHGGVLMLVPIHDDPIGSGADMLQGGDSASTAIVEEPHKD